MNSLLVKNRTSLVNPLTGHASYLGLLCLLLISACTSSGDQVTQPPNIVYILADDLGYGDLNCYNPESKIQTPHLDQLAAQGMCFLDMHSPSSVCTPTRYGILTGQYCWRSDLPQGVLRGYGRRFIHDDVLTVPELLAKQGYTTAVVGKWHLGLDWVLNVEEDSMLRSAKTALNENGVVLEMDPKLIDFSRPTTWGPSQLHFDYSYILPASLDMDPYCYLENGVLTEQPSAHTPGNDLHTGYTGAFWRAGRMSPSFDFYKVLPTFRMKAQNFLKSVADTDDPFFLYLPLPAPHTPWVPTANHDGSSSAGVYGDFVQMVDQEVGSLLNTLTELGLDDNTLVIFTSDNGPFWTPALIEEFEHRAAGKLRGMKADAYEGGHRIPYIARWPEHIPSNTKSNQLSCLTHLLATVAEIVEVDLAAGEGVDSKSLVPHFVDPHLSDPDAKVIHHSSRGYFAIRHGDWKYIEGLGSGGFSQPAIVEASDRVTGQLYNLDSDLGERKNLFADSAHLVDRMSTLLDQIRNPE